MPSQADHGHPREGDVTLNGLDWALKIDGLTGEFEYAGSFDHMLSEFWSLALGGSGALMTACRAFLGVQEKAEFLKIDGTTLTVKITTGPYAATFDRTGLLEIKGDASPRMELVLQKLGDVLAERCQ